MTLNKKKEIIKGLLLIAVLIFFIWGLILTINEDFIYADGTVYVSFIFRTNPEEALKGIKIA